MLLLWLSYGRVPFPFALSLPRVAEFNEKQQWLYPAPARAYIVYTYPELIEMERKFYVCETIATMHYHLPLLW